MPNAKGTGSAILNIGVTNIVAARRVLEGRGLLFRGETPIVTGKVSLAMFADPDGNALPTGRSCAATLSADAAATAPVSQSEARPPLGDTCQTFVTPALSLPRIIPPPPD